MEHPYSLLEDWDILDAKIIYIYMQIYRHSFHMETLIWIGEHPPQLDFQKGKKCEQKELVLTSCYP